MSNNYLKFPVTSSILTTYNTAHNQELFDTSDNTFLFYVIPSEYSPITDPLGIEGIVTGIDSTSIRNPSRRKGGEYTTRDEREVTLRVLAQLKADAEATTTKTITVHDYIDPDSGSFTIREMVMLNPVTRNGGSWLDGDGNRWYSGGFTIELLELAIA